MFSATDSALIEILAGQNMSREDKILVCLFSLGGLASVKEIRHKGLSLGISEIKAWNLSLCLKRASPLTSNTSKGWKLLQKGEARLRHLGVTAKETRLVEVALSLRSLINEDQTTEARKLYLNEAIQAFEHDLYRSAIVLTWVGAVSVIKEAIIKYKKSEFEKFYIARYPQQKWSLKSESSFERIKERDLIEGFEKVGLIGKSTKDELIERLSLRNRAGHPNSSSIAQNIAAAHIESLIKSVFLKF